MQDVKPLEKTLARRDAQIKRVIAALRHMPADRAIAIICMWMSADDVDAMLKTLEK